MITKEVEKTYTFLTQVLIPNKKLLSASLLAHVCPPVHVRSIFAPLHGISSQLTLAFWLVQIWTQEKQCKF